MVCERCKKPLELGEWPFCGGKNDHGFPLGGLSIVDDELPNGPYFCETLSHDPVYVTSKSHLRREAEARGLVCVGGRKPDSYYATQRRLLDEKRRDLKLGKDVAVSL
jgi:hypothetical protein